MSKLRVIATSLAAVLLLSVAATPAVVAKGLPLKAELSGAAEVPGPGDPDGSGIARFRLNQGQRRICFEIQVADIAPATAAHIHAGAAGVAGPVVVTLGTPDGTGFVKGCMTDVDRALIKAIRKHPADYYVNVHNADFPAGAVRGQLERLAPGRHRNPNQ